MMHITIEELFQKIKHMHLEVAPNPSLSGDEIEWIPQIQGQKLSQYIAKLLQEESTSLSLESLMKQFLRSPPEASSLHRLEALGFSLQWQYQVILFECEESQDFHEAIHSTLKDYFSDMLCIPTKHFFVCILYGEVIKDNDVAFQSIHQKLQENILPHLYTHCGKIVHGAQCICNSYEIAYRMSAIQRRSPRIITYSNSGIYKLLFNITDISVLEEYVNETISDILMLDRKNGNKILFTVLKSYLENDGSVIKTAQDLSVHRNTVHNKLKKLESLLKCDLVETKIRTKLMLAVMAHEIVLKGTTNNVPLFCTGDRL